MKNSLLNAQKNLQLDIENCNACPRLRSYCQEVGQKKRKSFLNDSYWAKPVPNFGDHEAKFLIVGLAPAAHGANRTGRMFTGDRSGLWLYRAIYKAGFSNSEESNSVQDSLKLQNCLITSIAHCAPPQNKPTPEELHHCRPFLQRTLNLHKPKIILALGQMAWNALCAELGTTLEIPTDSLDQKSDQRNLNQRPTNADTPQRRRRPLFKHGAKITFSDGTVLLGSYHPSQQNTFTGVLTEEMFDSIFSIAKCHLENLRSEEAKLKKRKGR